MHKSIIAKELEEEHSVIYSCYTQLFELNKLKKIEPDQKIVVINLLKTLLDYCTKHFENEEEFAKVIKIDFSEHKNLHNHFISKLDKLVNKYTRNLTSLSDVLFFIKNWLKSHINLKDKSDFQTSKIT